jgi:hypothetical protein
MKGERWPPVYDADDLANQIRLLTEGERLEREFFEWRLDRSTTIPSDICQGDVVTLKSDVPVILEDGQPGTLEHPESVWMVIGNSCDFDRTIDDARWTQLVPIGNAGPLGEVSAQLGAARRYTQARKFYVPPWSAEAERHLHIADLLLPVAVDKRAFHGPEIALQARMSRSAWILLNACLVRFLARDDGRYDI